MSVRSPQWRVARSARSARSWSRSQGPKYPCSRIAEAAPWPSPLRRRFAVGSAAQDLRRSPMTRRYTHLEHPHA